MPFESVVVDETIFPDESYSVIGTPGRFMFPTPLLFVSSDTLPEMEPSNTVGDVVGDDVGPAVGLDVGPAVGDVVGEYVGDDVGFDVGPDVGVCVGADDGTGVGTAVGPEVGRAVGVAVGEYVGEGVINLSTNWLFNESPELTSTLILLGLPPSLSLTSAYPGRFFSVTTYFPGGTRKLKLPVESDKVLRTVPLGKRIETGTPTRGLSPWLLLPVASSTCPTIRLNRCTTKLFPVLLGAGFRSTEMLPRGVPSLSDSLMYPSGVVTLTTYLPMGKLRNT